jgi:hypothetical protein
MGNPSGLGVFSSLKTQFITFKMIFFLLNPIFNSNYLQCLIFYAYRVQFLNEKTMFPSSKVKFSQNMVKTMSSSQNGLVMSEMAP